MIASLEFLLLALGLGVVFNTVLKAVGMPTVIGYILTGLSLRYFYNINESLEELAEFGLVFLMFTIGLEFSLKRLLEMKRAVFLNGALQILITGGLIALLAKYLFNVNENLGIILGLSLAMSSTAIVLKILNDSDEIKQRYGKKALGILIFQDLAVVPLILMIDFYSGKGDMGHLLVTTLFSALALLVMLYLISKYIFGAVLHFVIKSNSEEIFISTVLFTVIGASALAHHFGFSYSLGAFLAGILLAETRYKPRIETELIPFRDLLLGLFFITIGLQINLDLVFSNFVQIFLVLLFVGFLKFLVIFGILITHTSKRIALKTALSLAQIGEFGIAIFSLLASKGAISEELAQILILAAILSMIITPFIIKNIQKIADATNQNDIYESSFADELRGHFVIIGYGPTGEELVLRLKHKGLPYIVLESELDLVDLGKARGENVHFANAAHPSSLELANIKKSCAVIITLSNEDKLRLVMQALEGFKDINIVLRSYKKLRQLGLNSRHIHILRPEESIAKDLFAMGLKIKLENNEKLG